MSRKKKLVLLTISTFTLSVLAALGVLLWLQANPDGQLAQFLERRGVPVEAILEQRQVATVGEKLEEFIPGLQAKVRDTGEIPSAVSPTVFNAITLKGVIGTPSDSTALINAAGETHWLKVGGQFPVKLARGSVTVRCEEIRPGSVVLGVVNSDLRKEYALR